MKMFASLPTVGLGVLFGWIIKPLCSPSIRQEFIHE
jgi:hypothetical protein